MTENPMKEQGRAGIWLDKPEYTVSPAGNTTITITLRNQGLDDDEFTLGVGGIPAAWVSSPQPAVSLAPGEETDAALVIQPPGLDEIDTGERMLTIRATSQQHPGQFSDVKVKLAIQIETPLPHVAVEMTSTRVMVQPGGSTTFSLQLTNNGPTPETLRLFIDGIPTGWITTAAPITRLESGEASEISVTISPPRVSESRAGHHPFNIRLVSQQNPGKAAFQECILSIGDFVQFQSELLPESPVSAWQNAQIQISNHGNVNETFQVNWQSEEDRLAFKLWQKDGDETVFKEGQEQALDVGPGKAESAYFRVGLRNRPIIGGARLYPFQVQVRSLGGQEQAHDGEVRERAIIPIWLVPLVLALCVSLVCLGVFAYNWLQDGAPPWADDEAPPVAEDNSWSRVQEAGVLRVATAADYPPFSYYNDDFAIDGFDPALIKEIGHRLGLDVEISDYAFDGLGATLKVGQADVVIAAISVTPEREALFDFSNIYYVGQDGILARANSSIESITRPDQMAGFRIGVQRHSAYDSWAQDVLIASGVISQDRLYIYAKPEHAIDDLKQKRIDLVIMDLQPATLALSDDNLKLVGQGLNQQRLAIAVPKGAHALRAVIDQVLLAMHNEGRVNQLVQTYLGLRSEDIIPLPTPEPTPEIPETPTVTPTDDPNTATPAPCADAMEFVADLNYDDEDLTNFPLVDPGEAFRKGWRIKNSGTCTWNSTYFIQYTNGNDPAAQMDGQPTAIKGVVNPGQIYDIYVDLVAPQTAGKYVGYWQMHNAGGQAFGQTVWVAVKVRPEAPTATVTPGLTSTPPQETPPDATATQAPSEPTATEGPSEPTATEVPPTPTETPLPEATATQSPSETPYP